MLPSIPGRGNAWYEPNSFGGPTGDKRFAEPPLKISNDADRFDHRAGNDDCSVARRKGVSVPELAVAAE